MKIETRNLPYHWAPALINGDLSGYDGDELAAISAFVADMVAEYGACRCLDCELDSTGDFIRHHDAESYGVLACICTAFTFDATARKE